MAKVVPFGGMLLSGRVQNAVYCVRPDGTVYVRAWVKPADPKTVKQAARRDRMTKAVAAWKALSDDQRAKYAERAKYMRRYGYHLFLSEFMAGPVPD